MLTTVGDGWIPNHLFYIFRTILHGTRRHAWDDQCSVALPLVIRLVVTHDEAVNQESITRLDWIEDLYGCDA